MNYSKNTGAVITDENGFGTIYEEPIWGGDPKNVEGDDKEVVNEEDQNQVVNAQPVEEFISNYVNKEEPENTPGLVEGIEE